jgi:hypothetical protein
VVLGPVIAEDGIPEAWPALLSREQLCAYAGGISDATLRKVCPVRPVDLGANVLRYRRAEADAWLASLPHRGALRVVEEGEHDAAPSASTDRPSAAVERAKARAAGR